MLCGCVAFANVRSVVMACLWRIAVCWLGTKGFESPVPVMRKFMRTPYAFTHLPTYRITCFTNKQMCLPHVY